MDWQFKPPSKSSSVSGTLFSEGDRIICYLYLDDEAVIQRTDIREGEHESVELSGQMLGRWSRVVKAPEEEKREAKKAALATSEDMFLSLFAEDVPPSDEQDTLKQLLALMLERKRILRSLGAPSGDGQRYLHVKSREEFLVPMRELNSENVLRIQAQLDALVV